MTKKQRVHLDKLEQFVGIIARMSPTSIDASDDELEGSVAMLNWLIDQAKFIQKGSGAVSDKSRIEWTESTWTPIRARNLNTGKVGWYCEHASDGCRFCYAEGMNNRLGTGLPFKPGHRSRDIEIFLDEKMLLAPLRWRKPRMIFVCSMTDLFADFVRDEWIDRVFAMMALAPQHTFQVLTKRAERMRQYLNAEDVYYRIHSSRAQLYDGPDREPFAWPIPNVWIGVSAERQKEADERIPHLLATPSAVRFVSLEPLLGPIDIRQWMHSYGCGCGWGGQPLDYCNECGWRGSADGEIGVATCPEGHLLSDYNACPECDGHDGDGMSFGPNSNRLNWVIVGGESGPNARPFDIDWADALIKQCRAAGVPVFMKQLGSLPYSDGRPMHSTPRGKYSEPTEWPERLRFREIPNAMLESRMADR